MSLEPLLAASLLIQIHAFAALAAFALGIFQLMAPKGTVRHRTTGWIWAGLMATIVVTSFGIHDLRTWGTVEPNSPAFRFHGCHAAGRRRSRATASCEAASIDHRSGCSSAPLSSPVSSRSSRAESCIT